jgi:hypothetical protein
MSAAAHEREADQHDRMADDEGARTAPGCDPNVVVCWTPSRRDPDLVASHRRIAAQHRAASTALRDAEANACTGIAPDDRDVSPFERRADIAAVHPLIEQHLSSKQSTSRTVGATVTIRAVPGLTAEWLQRVVDCHLARNAALGHDVLEMPDCPLVPNGATARVHSARGAFAIDIRSDDQTTAADILARANRLVRR